MKGCFIVPKRYIAICIATIVFIMTLCIAYNKIETQTSINKSTKQDTTPLTTNAVETIKKIREEFDNYQSNTLMPIEYLYENADVAQKAKATQGLIKNITVNGQTPIVLVGNKVYAVNDTSFDAIFSLENEPKEISFCNSMQVGNLLVLNTQDNFYTALKSDGSTFFDNLELNENEYIYSISNNTLTTVTLPKSGNQTVKYYTVTEDGKLKKTDTVSVYQHELNNNKKVKMKETVSTAANIGTGYYIYCISKDGELYRATGCMRYSRALSMETIDPIASDVDNIYSSATISLFTTCPLYSKADDMNTIYSKVAGNDLSSAADDLDISFALPEGYTKEEIKNTIGCGTMIIFEFTDGNLYTSEKILNTEAKAYQLHHLKELSLLNQEGLILKMCGTNSPESYIYILLSNNKLYYSEV